MRASARASSATGLGEREHCRVHGRLQDERMRGRLRQRGRRAVRRRLGQRQQRRVHVHLKLNVCGDSYVNVGVEECDDWNGINTDACTATCTVAPCGDGFTQGSNNEDCDITSAVPGTGCDATCGLTETSCRDTIDNDGDGDTDDQDYECLALAFVTSHTFNGNLSSASIGSPLGCSGTGAAAGDCLCATVALLSVDPTVSDPTKTWQAYLADSGHAAKAGIPDRPYKRADGVVFADGIGDLLGTMNATLHITENGMWVGGAQAAWTGLSCVNTCSDWTDGSGGGAGNIGDVNVTDAMGATQPATAACIRDICSASKATRAAHRHEPGTRPGLRARPSTEPWLQVLGCRRAHPRREPWPTR